jgi:hypothetical protein
MINIDKKLRMKLQKIMPSECESCGCDSLEATPKLASIVWFVMREGKVYLNNNTISVDLTDGWDVVCDDCEHFMEVVLSE